MIPDRPFFTFQAMGVPVDINGTALLILAFLALSFGSSGTQGLVAGLAYGVALVVSILIHELGHAVVGQRLGLQPERIELHGFGGFTYYGRRPKPKEGLISALAGPAAGLLFGGLLLGVQLVAGSSLPHHAAWLLQAAIWINFFWSGFNLLPMHPLDGGHALWYALRLKLKPARADRIVRNVTIPVAILTGVAGFLAGYVFIPLICFFALMQVMRT